MVTVVELLAFSLLLLLLETVLAFVTFCSAFLGLLLRLEFMDLLGDGERQDLLLLFPVLFDLVQTV